MTPRSADRPRRALARHSAGTCISLLKHSRVTCVSLQLHLSFICSSLFHMCVTCGSLGQQSVQCMLQNLTYQGLEASFFKALASSLVSSQDFTFFCHLYVTRRASQSVPGLNEDTHYTLLMIAGH